MVPVDPDKLRSRIDHVRSRLSRLRGIGSKGEEEFLSDPILQDAAVRSLQTSIEALLDMANHIVAREVLGLPETYHDAIALLVDADVLPASRADAFHAMVGFRNRAVHVYDEIDPEVVFRVIRDDLTDFETFLGALVDRYLPES